MSTPIAALAKAAATPEQAKVWVAMLQANGIPAHVDGESLVDEYAISRRLMNLLGVNVMVPSNCVAQAREILQPAEIDSEELTRQAMAAADIEFDGRVAPVAAGPNRRWRWQLLLLLWLAPLLALLAYTTLGWMSGEN